MGGSLFSISLLSLFLIALSASPSPSAETLKPGYVLVQARGLVMMGSPLIANEALALPRNGILTAIETLEKLSKYGALNFSTSRMPEEAGERAGEVVVTSINQVEALAPITAWLVSTKRPSPGNGPEEIIENINLDDTLLLAGDVLSFQLTRADEIPDLVERLENTLRSKLDAEKQASKSAVPEEPVATTAKQADADVVDLDNVREADGNDL
jgi:hypothetical protein